ncbi:hypothetical protein BXU11_17095 [Flavobacterium sp. LM5]|uniref:hypothetical protein n=1 Tax=Flavobacterium sp. LM5 TaxID=1938610 RepID=UPI00099407DA|nr:hypothetical protein [Flavobacterium sp. LM5]OOV21030.1 hypothetical protein BXU11_17095 [Flavobacterium sp. LM5]
MKLKYKNYEIEVFDEPNYTLNSVDNLRFYDKVYFEGEHQEDRFIRTASTQLLLKNLKPKFQVL